MKVCSKCKREKDEEEMTYFPYLDQWICSDCINTDDIVEEEYLECMVHDPNFYR